MMGRLLSKEESNAALIVALSGAIAVLVAWGRGVLSNPIPRTRQRSRGEAPIPESGSTIAA
jgi:hypothetical protein